MNQETIKQKLQNARDNIRILEMDALRSKIVCGIATSTDFEKVINLYGLTKEITILIAAYYQDYIDNYDLSAVLIKGGI